MKKIFSILACFCVLAVGCIAVACSSSHKHAWGDWTTTKNPTCTEQGEKTRKCDDCDKVETEKIDALGHAYEDQSSVATEFEAAKTWKKCSRCGHETEKQDVGTKLTVDLVDEANSAFGLFGNYMFPNVPVELAGSTVNSQTVAGYISAIAQSMGGSAEGHNLYTYFYVDLGEHEFTTLKINGETVAVGTDKSLVHVGNHVYAELEIAVVEGEHLYVLAYYLVANSFENGIVKIGLDNREMNVDVIDSGAQLAAEPVDLPDNSSSEITPNGWDIVWGDTSSPCFFSINNGNVSMNGKIIIAKEVRNGTVAYGMAKINGVDSLPLEIVEIGSSLEFDEFVVEYEVYIPGQGIATFTLNVSAYSEF